jgi:arginyl-tRNA synthetase
MIPIEKALSEVLKETVSEALGERVETDSLFEVPREEKFGDLTTNLVLRLAKERKRAPRPLAEEVRAALESRLARDPSLAARVEKIAVEGPGFINFHYSAREIAGVLGRIRAEGKDFGRPKGIAPKNILLEYVSANPTGPLTVAHGRQAALGDSLARILAFCGHKVSREYYNNDEGVQIRILGRSIRSRYLTEIGVENPFPEDGYQGDYIRDIAKDLVTKHGRKLEKEGEEPFARHGREIILEGIKKDLKDFDVTFDEYFSQEALMRSGKVERALEALRKKGFVYEKDGAVWFESTKFGDDKDRVLVKSDKSHTYLLPDIAYHEEKFARGYDFMINILGPDHHGYISRIKASTEALGHPKGALEILIAQLVTLFEGGQQVRMSTRAGEFITLREILDEVGKDAGRFFFVMRKFDAHLDFDLALAKSQTPENPVFYIQYAHARIESVKKTFEERGEKVRWDGDDCLALLSSPQELALMRVLAQYERTVLSAERTLEPYRLVPYLMDLAAAFHRFYTEHRVVTEDAAATQARMRLVLSAQAVLRSGLELLGVSAPLKM